MSNPTALEERLDQLSERESKDSEARAEFVKILEQNPSLCLKFRNPWLRHKIPGEFIWPAYGNDVYLLILSILPFFLL